MLARLFVGQGATRKGGGPGPRSEPGGDDFEGHRHARREVVAVFVKADIRDSTEAIAMLAIHESSAGRADRQGADFEDSLELLRELALEEVIIDALGAVALTNLIAAVGRFVSPPAENNVAAVTSPISSAAKSMNRHSRASDRTQAICLGLAAWRANISRIIRCPEKRTIGFLGQAVKTP